MPLDFESFFIVPNFVVFWRLQWDESECVFVLFQKMMYLGQMPDGKSVIGAGEAPCEYAPEVFLQVVTHYRASDNDSNGLGEPRTVEPQKWEDTSHGWCEEVCQFLNLKGIFDGFCSWQLFKLFGQNLKESEERFEVELKEENVGRFERGIVS